MPWTKILGYVGQLGSSIVSVIGGALTLVNNMLAAGFRTAMQYHEEGIAFARTVGLSAKEAVAYTEVLTKRAIDLGEKYGIAAEAVKDIQKNIVDATGKQYMLNQQEAERMIQINKLVGAETGKAFTEEIMNHLGGQLSTAQNAVSKAYATAAKSGLSAAKFSEKVARNLTLANKLSFRDGVNGIIRMTALSEKLGFNLQSIGGVADKFLELDKAITSSAQLQMLGGPAAAFGANPLTMAYEANYDPEALTERMTNMLAGYATFNRATGLAEVNGMNRDFVKAISEAMGISMDEAMSIAKKQAEIRYKQSAYGRELGNISAQNRDAVLNRSYIDTQTGHLMINDVSGGTHDITANGLDESILEELQKFDGMSEKELMEKQAIELTSINEKIEGIWTTLGGQLADVFNKHMPKILGAVDDIGKHLTTEAMPKITKALGKLIDDVLTPENIDTIKNTISDLADNAAEFLAHGVDFFDDAISWLDKLENKAEAILMAIIGWGFYKNFGNYFKSLGKGATGANAPGANGPKPNGGGGGGGPKPNSTAKPNTAKPKNTTNPSGGNLNKPTNTIKYKGHTYKQDGNGNWKVQQKNGSWKNADRNLRGTLNSIKNQQTAAPTGANPANTNNTTTTNNTSGAPKANPKASVIKGGLKAGAKGSWLSVLVGAYESITSALDYSSEKERIAEDKRKSDEQKKEALEAAKRQRNAGVGSGIGTAAGGVAGGAIGGAAGGAVAGAIAGAAAGSVVPVIGNIIGAAIGLGIGMAGAYYGSKIGQNIGNSMDATVTDEELKNMKKEKHAYGGVVGGNSRSGDKILAGLNSGEAVVTPKQFHMLFDMAESVVKAMEYGANREYIYKATRAETSNVNGNTITVKDFNVNLNGTLKLDAGTAIKSIDMNALLNDISFMNALKELIKDSINRDMNGGRFNNDLAWRRGQTAPLSILNMI